MSSSKVPSRFGEDSVSCYFGVTGEGSRSSFSLSSASLSLSPQRVPQRAAQSGALYNSAQLSSPLFSLCLLLSSLRCWAWPRAAPATPGAPSSCAARTWCAPACIRYSQHSTRLLARRSLVSAQFAFRLPPQVESGVEEQFGAFFFMPNPKYHWTPEALQHAPAAHLLCALSLSPPPPPRMQSGLGFWPQSVHRPPSTRSARPGSG